MLYFMFILLFEMYCLQKSTSNNYWLNTMWKYYFYVDDLKKMNSHSNTWKQSYTAIMLTYIDVNDTIYNEILDFYKFHLMKYSWFCSKTSLFPRYLMNCRNSSKTYVCLFLSDQHNICNIYTRIVRLILWATNVKKEID